MKKQYAIKKLTEQKVEIQTNDNTSGWASATIDILKTLYPKTFDTKVKRINLTFGYSHQNGFPVVNEASRQNDRKKAAKAIADFIEDIEVNGLYELRNDSIFQRLVPSNLQDILALLTIVTVIAVTGWYSREYTMSQKFDKDKIELQETKQKQNKTIDSLKKVVTDVSSKLQDANKRFDSLKKANESSKK